ncbi:barwin-like endoglucanase [Biscogniauxia mediterranea]|nr:barwin-like endoglucanase [Biscogniauxia mediterranea]
MSFSGDMPYPTPGLGACGRTSTEADAVVAQYGSDPDPNRASVLCGRRIRIRIRHGGRSATTATTVRQRQQQHRRLARQLADLAQGRRVEVSWEFI